MEDILQFLFIAGFIIISIVGQLKKESKKSTDNQFDTPLPEEEIDKDATPVPQSWGRPYADRTTEKLSHRTATTSTAPTRVAPSKKVSPSPPPAPQTSDSNPDYSIHSVEEARKAIIWSEILQNKWTAEK